MKERNHAAEYARRNPKYYQFKIDVPRKQWESLTPSQQSDIKQRVREIISKMMEELK